MISIRRSGITLGPLFVRLSRRYLADWGYEALRIGGLALWSRTNDGDRTIASYHPQKSLSWHWVLALTKKRGGMFSTESRARMAQLYADGNPHVAEPSWRDRFMRRDQRRSGQWHDYYRLPFGCALRVSGQDYHKRRRA